MVLGLGLDGVREHLFNEDDLCDDNAWQPLDFWRTSLALEVLGELAQAGRADARALLRDYAVTGANWTQALDELTQDPDASALDDDLREVTLHRLDDDALALAVTPGWGPWERWAPASTRIQRALEDAASPGAADAGPVLALDTMDREKLRSLVVSRASGVRKATEELARRGDSDWLLEHLEQVMDDPEQPFAPAGLVAATRLLPVEAVLTRARAWATAFPDSQWPLMIISRHAESQDEPLMLRTLAQDMESEIWSGAVSAVKALGLLRSQAATPLLQTAWERSPYAYLRPRLLDAQLHIDASQARSWLDEGLWDCEETVRLTSITRSRMSDSHATELRRLSGDPSEEASHRNAAKARLDPPSK